VQQVAWEIDQDIPHSPDIITRIRVLNSTQHNEFVVGENISMRCPYAEFEYGMILTLFFILVALYTDGNKGDSTFRLGIEDVTGLYHYRIMVNYPVSCLTGCHPLVPPPLIIPSFFMF
jgi:hypothetical protein